MDAERSAVKDKFVLAAELVGIENRQAGFDNPADDDDSVGLKNPRQRYFNVLDRLDQEIQAVLDRCEDREMKMTTATVPLGTIKDILWERQDSIAGLFLTWI